MMPNSVLLIDKPKGMTSHDVVDEVRRVTGERRVGHAGTLDPMATGLLIVLVGREVTKRQSEFMGLEKEYEAEITFGVVSDTYDAEGEVVGGVAGEFPRVRLLELGSFPSPAPGDSPPESLDLLKNLTEGRVKEALKDFRGVIEQQVPPYAAVKIRGKKLYEYARAGRLDEIKLPVRKVKVRQFELLYFSPSNNLVAARPRRAQKQAPQGGAATVGGLPKAEVRVVCSKGTYIRSLAHDLGQKLGTGAILTALRRTRIGSYNVENAVGLDRLSEKRPKDES